MLILIKAFEGGLCGNSLHKQKARGTNARYYRLCLLKYNVKTLVIFRAFSRCQERVKA